MDAFAAMPGAVLSPDLTQLLLAPGGFKVDALLAGASAPLAGWPDTNSDDAMDAAEMWLGALDATGCEGAWRRGAARAQQLESSPGPPAMTPARARARPAWPRRLGRQLEPGARAGCAAGAAGACTRRAVARARRLAAEGRVFCRPRRAGAQQRPVRPGRRHGAGDQHGREPRQPQRWPPEGARVRSNAELQSPCRALDGN